MKLNDYEINNVFIVIGGVPIKVNYYKSDVLYNSVNLFGEPEKNCTTDYYDFIFDIKKVNKNNVESNLKKGFSCVVIEKKKDYYPYNNIYSLYLNTDIIESFEKIERKEEKEKGLTNVSYDYLLTLKNNYLIAYDSQYCFCKTDEEALSLSRNFENIKKVSDCFDDAKTEKAKNFYKEKLDQGYIYRVFVYKAIKKESKKLLLSGCVDHYEKDNFYKQVERITKIMNSCTYKSDTVYTSQVIKMLNYLNISIKKGK